MKIQRAKSATAFRKIHRFPFKQCIFSDLIGIFLSHFKQKHSLFWLIYQKMYFRLHILSFAPMQIYIYAFDRHFYPKWIAQHVISSCIPWESNSWPWQYYYCNALLLNASWFRWLYWGNKNTKNITLYSVIILHQTCHAKCLDVNVYLSNLVLLRVFDPCQRYKRTPFAQTSSQRLSDSYCMLTWQTLADNASSNLTDCL